jgi:hypothetical protein
MRSILSIVGLLAFPSGLRSFYFNVAVYIVELILVTGYRTGFSIIIYLFLGDVLPPGVFMVFKFRIGVFITVSTLRSLGFKIC